MDSLAICSGPKSPLGDRGVNTEAYPDRYTIGSPYYIEIEIKKEVMF